MYAALIITVQKLPSFIGHLKSGTAKNNIVNSTNKQVFAIKKKKAMNRKNAAIILYPLFVAILADL